MSTKLFEYGCLVFFLLALGAYCVPFLEREINMGADGLALNAPREAKCPNGCDWTARYMCRKNADGENVGFFKCFKCDQCFSVEDILHRATR